MVTAKGVSGTKTTRTFFPFYVEEGGVVVKYYAFNGQIIATRRGGALSYLHTDHLGSNSVSTNASGVETARRTYYAYGSPRTSSGTLPTDRTYTGQEQDGTGLMYFRARYVDPALGTFLSPDTLVPDPGRAIDYNRFAFVRGNPLKYNDPSGHCAVNEDGSRSGDDAECWQLADTIYAMWDADGWWQDHFGVDRDYFMQNLAGLDILDANWMQGQMDSYLTNFYQRTGLHHAQYNPAPDWHKPPPQPIAPRLTDVLTGRCEIVDCTVLVIDVVAFAGTVVVIGSSAICGPGAPACVAAVETGGQLVSTAATATGFTRTLIRARNGEANATDVVVTSFTSGTSRSAIGPVTGFGQLMYDFFAPPVNASTRGH